MKVRASLPRPARLFAPGQFTGQFAQRLQGNWYQVLARPNGEPNLARLGLIVGRRAASRAVDRSLARRLAREEFRKVRHMIVGIDVVVRLRVAVTRADRTKARNELRELLARLEI